MKFHPFAERFPLLDGDEWEAFKESIKEAGGNSVPISFRLVDGVEQGLDGRNRWRACDELNLPCKVECVSVDDADVWQFISDRNLHRRHMSTAARRELVSDMRAEGKSIRKIAASVGVGVATVHRDLENQNEQETHKQTPVPNGTPDKKPQQIKGNDGKTYTKKASIFCGRCQRTGPVKNCPSCAEERKGEKAKREPGGINPKRQPSKSGKELFDWKAFNTDFGKLLRQVDTLGKAYGCKESTEAEKLRDLLSEFSTGFKSLYSAKSGSKAPK